MPQRPRRSEGGRTLQGLYPRVGNRSIFYPYSSVGHTFTLVGEEIWCVGGGGCGSFSFASEGRDININTCIQAVAVGPSRVAVPFWGHTSRITRINSLSPKRDRNPRRINPLRIPERDQNDIITPLRTAVPFGDKSLSDLNGMSPKRDCSQVPKVLTLLLTTVYENEKGVAKQ